MSADTVTESELLRASFARRNQRLDAAERRGELVVGTGFLAAAAALCLTVGVPGSFSIALAVAYVVLLALAGRVRFDVGAGFTVPSQVLFVPMLFALPIALVPVLVLVSLVLGMAPGVVRGRVPVSRLLLTPGNSWFALGPAIVLAVAHVSRPDSDYGLLVAVLAAQFAGDFTANAAREWLSGELTISEMAAETRWIYLVDAALAPIGLAVALATAHHPWAVLLVAPLLALLRVFSAERRARLEQLVELNDAYRGTALVLGDMVEADDTYTGQHCRGVVRLGLDVAEQLALDRRQRRNVEFGALLHDIGKVAVPKAIINKPGKLDDREWEVIKTHTLEGQRMLDRVGGTMRAVGLVVRSSHERWDGAGYPDGLSGEQIPLESRIVCACDAFNAMTTTRPYRRAMSLDDALAELQAGAGTQFDPGVVDALVRVVRR